MSKEVFESLTQADRLYRIRHSVAHVMAEAVRRLFPGTKIAIGPPIKDGFYYDFDIPQRLIPDDLEKIETLMRKIIAESPALLCSEISRADAEAKFADEPYKREIINDLPDDEQLTVYEVAGFSDLCKGPHVDDCSRIPSDGIKLLSIAGAYWRGDEKQPMLQRIYGTAWENKEELDAYLQKRKDIEQKDHRKIGKELQLFSLHEEAGPGLVYWHPKGARMRSIIEDYWKQEHFENGYELLYTPHVGKSWLWEQSGHLDNFIENMYAPMKIDKADYYAKPMNCPFHIMIYKSRKYSYHDLPLRWAELGTVYRYERSGVLHGLLRVRGFTQDDAHIFCSPDQVEQEISEVLRFSLAMWKVFHFEEITAYIATKPTKSVGNDEDWDRATAALERAVQMEGMDYKIDEGGGAFYGPKIDLKVRDALGREWQMTTIQFDFNLPERFDMVFVDSDGKEKRPYMVHRALLGSLERFFAVLLEHYGGVFPLWLAPIQGQIIPVSPVFHEQASDMAKRLCKEGFRFQADLSKERMGAKIRRAQLEKIPCMLILGEKEIENNEISYRRLNGEQENGIPYQDFIQTLQECVKARTVL